MKIETIGKLEFDRIPGIRQIICHEYPQTLNEILLLNLNGALRFNRGLPDVPEQFYIAGNNIVIELVDGDRFSLNVETGQFQKLIGEIQSA